MYITAQHLLLVFTTLFMPIHPAAHSSSPIFAHIHPQVWAHLFIRQVLVHCVEGVSRSCSVVMAWLLANDRTLTCPAAFRILKRAHRPASDISKSRACAQVNLMRVSYRRVQMKGFVGKSNSLRPWDRGSILITPNIVSIDCNQQCSFTMRGQIWRPSYRWQ